MENLYLRIRLSHKYVGTYRHLDKWRYVGTVRLTPPKQLPSLDDDPDPSEGPTYVQVGRLPRGMDPKVVIRALEDTLSAHGCAHEWDCCGCPSYRAEATIHRRRIRVITSVTYNY